MFKWLIHSFAGIRHNFHTYFVYEILSVLLTSFIWVPTYTFIYKKTLHWMGTDALINNRVLNVVLNYKGMLGIAAIFLLCLMVIFVQIGLLIIISQKSCFHKEITLTDALFFVVQRVPRFFRLGILFILPFFLLFILITQSPLLEVVTDKYNVQIFLSNQLSIFCCGVFSPCTSSFLRGRGLQRPLCRVSGLREEKEFLWYSTFSSLTLSCCSSDSG